MTRSFVQTAPEIAEEILGKVAGIPKELVAFRKDLLSKEASSQEAALEPHRRMTVADLQKLAAPVKTDLPKIASVSADSWREIAGDLQKMAARNDAEVAREVFETGAALAAKTAAPGAVGGLYGKAPGMWTRAKAFMGGTNAKQVVERHDTLHEIAMGKLRKQLPKNPLEVAEEKKHDLARETGERRGRLAEQALASAPSVAFAAGTPLAAAAMMQGGRDRKKEEVKIYK